MLGVVLDRRYRVLRTLGQGGMGTVYLVENLLQERMEALKLLRPLSDVGAAESASRFRREARAIHRLRHPNIIALHHFGRLPDQCLYLSMEYVEGQDLSRLLRAERLALSRALPLLLQLAGAIRHAHSRGVIHRDLKPTNLLVTRTGEGELLKVLDFGIAKIIDPYYRDSVMSGMDGEILATPAYVAPEQLTGLTDDPRTDIYAFGCIAFEILTGTPPFTGRIMEVCQAHLRTPPPRPRDVDDRIPEEIEALILRCLAKRPQERVQSGDEIVRTLTALGEPASASAGEPSTAPCTTAT